MRTSLQVILFVVLAGTGMLLGLLLLGVDVQPLLRRLEGDNGVLSKAVVKVQETIGTEDKRLRWKFKAGDTFYTETITKSKQTIEMDGEKGTTEKTTTTVVRYRVEKQIPDGAVLEMTMEGTKVQGNDPIANFASAFADSLNGHTFRVTLDSNGQLTAYEGFDAFIEKVSGNNKAAVRFIRATGMESTITEGIRLLFGFLPDKAPVQGDHWKRKVRLPLGPIGTMGGDLNYTYEGSEAEGEKISYQGPWTYEPPQAAEDAPIKVTRADVKAELTKGSILFNATTGRLVRMDNEYTMKGTITMKSLTNQKTMGIELAGTSTLRVHEKNPLK